MSEKLKLDLSGFWTPQNLSFETSGFRTLYTKNLSEIWTPENSDFGCPVSGNLLYPFKLIRQGSRAEAGVDRQSVHQHRVCQLRSRS